ncbi:MAG: virginiamycin B lyase family protein [Methylocella sp.]
MTGKSRESGERRIKRENSMRLIASVLLLLLSAGAALAAEAPGTIAEFALVWPGGVCHSTHELAYANNGGGFWVTGQNQDHIARVKLDGTPEYFAMPKGSGPHGMDFDKEGRLWVSLEMAGLIVRLDDKGNIAEKVDVALRSPGAKQPINPSPHGIAFGPDGMTVWFTGKRTGTIGKVDPDGTVTHFALKTIGSVPIYLEAGPDGNMWGTELVGNKILQVKPGGEITEFSIPTPNSRPIAIVPGPDTRSMWFSEEAGNNVARIDMDGKITEYPIPQSGKSVILAGLAFDRDGNLWTQMYATQPNYFGDADHVIKVDKAIASAPAGDLSGVPITYYRTRSHDTVMHRIKQGPDGNMWFTELNADKIGRLTTGAIPAR